MTDNKGGPVKPPVIDLSAREGAKPEPANKSNGTAARPGEPAGAGKAAANEPPRAATPPSSGLRPEGEPNGGSMALGIVGGGVLGLAAAYALAWAGLWPSSPDPRVAEVSQMLPQIRQVVTGVPDLQTAIAETAAGMDGLDERIATLESTAQASAPAAAAGTAPAPDLSSIEAEIASLTERLDALGTAPAGDGGGETVAALRGSLDTLAAQVTTLETRIGEQEAQLEGMGETLAATQATVAAQPSDIGAAVRLPLVLSSMEAAFAEGRPFSAELDALRRAAPEMEVPQTLIDAAGTGLPRREAIERTFAAVLPAMLADRPADPDADWQQATLDWLRARLALRPVGDVEGDSPEAQAARLEAAIARGDYATADELVAALPEPMRAAAGDVPQMVAMRADAARLLEAVRRAALTLAGESAS